MLLLSSRAAAAVRRGHPWVYRDQLERPQLRDGEEVIVGHKGEALGRGLACKEGPIAVRLWTQKDVRVDAHLFRERLEQAVRLRRQWVDPETNAFRVVHGEGDRMPGLVVDKYGSVLVATLDDAGLAAHRDALFEEIFRVGEELSVKTLLHRTGRRGEEKRVELVRGEAGPMRVQVKEHGVPFVVDLAHGQKTGAFLDQRENRRRVGELARGKRVLNLFSYAGGFSLMAALGGAKSVTSVDLAAQGHADALESFKLAGASTQGCEWVTQDAFAFLTSAAARGDTWDLVISDPPSFAPSEKAVPKALGAYRSLHRACAAVTAPGGVLCAASCSSHVTAEMFAGTLDDASLETDRFRIVEVRGAGADHPVLAAFPEGRYLKFFVLA